MRTDSLLHIFRNTPFGRDTFLQSAYFAKRLGVALTVYIPRHHQFLMYFDRKAVTVDLDKEFLFDPKSAKGHVDRLIRELDIDTRFFEPTDYTALDLPDVPVDFKFMCCPRSISDLSAKIGMGYIGPKVRQIIQNAAFPVLMPTPVFKEWRRIVVFFGGSDIAVDAVREALEIKNITGYPLQLFTKGAGKPQRYYEDLLNANNLLGPLNAEDAQWQFFERGAFGKLLYEVPSDALVVAGAYGHGIVRELIFGSKVEKIQSVLPNNILLIGPGCI